MSRIPVIKTRHQCPEYRANHPCPEYQSLRPVTNVQNTSHYGHSPVCTGPVIKASHQCPEHQSLWSISNIQKAMEQDQSRPVQAAADKLAQSFQPSEQTHFLSPGEQAKTKWKRHTSASSGVKPDLLTLRAQELCESRSGRPGLPSLISLRFLWT